MNNWVCKFKRWSSDSEQSVIFAATTFAKAIERAKIVIYKKTSYRSVEITGFIRTAVLDG